MAAVEEIAGQQSTDPLLCGGGHFILEGHYGLVQILFRDFTRSQT